MWKFLNFGASRRAQREGPATVPPMMAPTLLALNQRRELLRVVLRDVLRKNGIPVEWIGFEMVPLSHHAGHAQPDVHLVHLVVMKWHEHLMDFAPALEEQLWRGLIRIAPDLERSAWVLGWKFAPGCGCPFAALPAAEFWTTQQAAAVPHAQPAKKFDLPPSEYDHRSSGFAPTQPGEMV